MRYKVIYKNGRPEGVTKEIEEEAWQLSARHIVDSYAIQVPRIKTEQYSLKFILDYKTSKMEVDPDSMSAELIKDINEKFG